MLFSGGLDSLAAAIEHGTTDVPLELVSHYTHNSVTAGAQKNLAKMANAAGYYFTHRRFFVSSRSGKQHNWSTMMKAHNAPVLFSFSCWVQ